MGIPMDQKRDIQAKIRDKKYDDKPAKSKT